MNQYAAAPKLSEKRELVGSRDAAQDLVFLLPQANLPFQLSIIHWERARNIILPD